MKVRGGRERYFWLGLVLLLAVSVLLLAWPRFLASFRYIPVDLGLHRYFADRQIPTERLPVLVDFANEAIAWNDHYRYRAGLSELQYLRGLDPYTPALERRPAYREAETQAVLSLHQAPAQPAVWLRVALVRWILHDEPETVVQPWKMSIFTGRTDAGLYVDRVEMGLAWYGYLDDEGRDMLRDQLQLAWNTHPGSLVKVLARRDSNLALTRDLLENWNPAALAELESLLEKVR